MSEGTHLKSIPRQIEPRKFASQEVELTGPIPAEELTRLKSACVGINSVEASVKFFVDDRREKVVKGQVNADLQVQCQRCLEAANLQLMCDVHLAIVWTQEKAKQLPENYDPWVVEEDEADLYSALEEEILLNLPYVVYHDYACVDAKLLHSEPASADEASGIDKANPFQVLKQLKEKTKK